MNYMKTMKETKTTTKDTIKTKIPKIPKIPKNIKIQSVLMISLGLIAIVSLSGCSTLEKILPPTKREIAQRKAAHRLALKRECNDTDVLLSDLTKPVKHRTYSLRPGVVCHD